MKFDVVFSVSQINDLYAWKFCHRKILDNVEGENYVLCVPDSQVKIYTRNTSRRYQIYSESEFFPELSNTNLAKLLHPSKRSKSGWYYQQFLKLQAIRRCRDFKTMLFIEGDSFPTPKFNPGDEDLLVYMTSSEEHKPYFQTLSALFDFERQVSFSFISQIFPLQIDWGLSFLDDIERRFGTPWYVAIVSSFPNNHVIEFSEYESLGNYFVNKSYPIKVGDGVFLRNAGFYYKDLLAESKLYRELCETYSLLAVEKADTRSFFNRFTRKIQRLYYG